MWAEAEDSQSGGTVDNSILRLRTPFRHIQADLDVIRSVGGMGYQWVLKVKDLERATALSD